MKFKFRKAYCNLHVKYTWKFGLIVKVLFLSEKYLVFLIFYYLGIFFLFYSRKKFHEIVISINMLVICNGSFKSGSSWLHAIILEIFRIKSNLLKISLLNIIQILIHLLEYLRIKYLIL